MRTADLQQSGMVKIYLYFGIEVACIWIGRLNRYGLASWLKDKEDPLEEREIMKPEDTIGARRMCVYDTGKTQKNRL